jgi:hypothetical protein
VAAVCGVTGLAQQPASNPLLPTKQALELYNHVLQLVDATMLATPELSRAGAPLRENARQAFANIQGAPSNSEFH